MTSLRGVKQRDAHSANDGFAAMSRPQNPAEPIECLNVEDVMSAEPAVADASETLPDVLGAIAEQLDVVVNALASGRSRELRQRP